MLAERIDDEFRVEAVLDDASLIFSAALEGSLVDLGKPLLARHLEKPRTEGSCERHDRTSIVHVFVDQLVVEANPMTRDRRLWHQRRVGKGFIDVVEDQRRFDDDIAVMHECWHDAIWIELHVSRIVLITLQREQMLLVGLTLFRDRNAHLLRADRIDVMIELEHAFLRDYFSIGLGVYAANLARS